MSEHVYKYSLKNILGRNQRHKPLLFIKNDEVRTSIHEGSRGAHRKKLGAHIIFVHELL